MNDSRTAANQACRAIQTVCFTSQLEIPALQVDILSCRWISCPAEGSPVCQMDPLSCIWISWHAGGSPVLQVDLVERAL